MSLITIILHMSCLNIPDQSFVGLFTSLLLSVKANRMPTARITCSASHHLRQSCLLKGCQPQFLYFLQTFLGQQRQQHQPPNQNVFRPSFAWFALTESHDRCENHRSNRWSCEAPNMSWDATKGFPALPRPLVVFVGSIRKLGSGTSSTYETNWNLHLTNLSFLVVGLKDSSGFPYKFTALSYKGWKFSSNRTPLPMSSPLSRAICWLWALMPTESGLQPCNWRDGNRKYIIVVYIVHTYPSICTCVCVYIYI